ncbi:lipase chaperone [Gordonia rubripertincta]|uniref:lipase chaperone n=1 Tax=Gordonia rubripertincta TaxID=36822 RepID=UPI0015FB8B31|nr:lipase chaperone [Gordonia rubripertincta]QMU19009.1 lipase chaperone [Gordonia rubripertincta]
MADFVLTASLFEQVVERDAHGYPLKVIRHRRGDIVSGLDEADVARLLDAGAIAPVPAENPAIVVVDADTDVVSDEDAVVTDDEAPAVAPVPELAGDPARPRITATKKVWVEYAVARGWTAADADDLDKQALIEALS